MNTESIKELRRLHRQVGMAIEMIDHSHFYDMTTKEKEDHKAKFGPAGFVIGDFVITRRDDYAPREYTQKRDK